MPDKCRSLKKVRKILSIVLLSLLGIIILTGILVNIPAVQNWLVGEATRRLSEQLQTRVEIRAVSLRLFNRALLEGAYVEDRHKDTLLYAGALEVRITDWFFFQDKPVLKFIGLENAEVNLVRPRNDSLWNYQFIVDAFSSAPDTSRKTTPSKGVSLDLRKIDLRNIRINKIDRWVGEDMRASAKRVYLDAKNLDLQKHNVDIQELLLDQPSFIISSYSSSPLRKRKPKTDNTPIPVIDSTGKLRWNSSNWKLIVKELSIRNGLFGVDNPEDSSAVEEGYFAPHHIRFGNINLSLNNTSLVKDSIIGDLTLSTKERSGFEVKKLTARFKMSPVEMEFSQMDLITNRSHLRNYYTMQYSDLSDMGDYVDLVFMKARFVNSNLSSDDIAYFAPPLSGWKKEISLNGVVEGPVSNLDADSVSLQAGNTTSLKGRMKMRGLPDIDETFMDLQAEQLVTTGSDVQRIFPDVKNVQPLQMDRLSSIRFQGSFTGFVNDFVAYGKFQTNLGNVDSDLNFKTSSDVPVYSGSLTTNNFDLGALLNVPRLSTVSLSAKVNGAGFNLRTLKAELDADIRQISVYGYTYTNIKTSGEMNRKFFNGSLTVNDPNLDMDFAGTIDLNGNVPVFRFNSEIRKSHLKALKLTSDSITLQSRLDLNFAGSNIDNFDGTARIYDVSLYKNQSRVDFDSLNISTHLENNTKVLDIKGNEITGYVKGSYSFLELPNAFQLFLNKYYPSFFPSPPSSNIREDFSFDFQFGEVDKLIRAFNTQVSGFDNTRVSGTLNTIQGAISLNATVPAASYQGYNIQDLQLKGSGNFNKIDVSTSIGKVSSGDQVWMQNPLILASSSHDTSFIKMDMQSQDTNSLDGFYARVITVNEGVKINFLNSAFTVNDRQWNMTPGNEIYWSKHFLTISNLRVTRNEQSITVETNEFNPDESRFMITLKDLNLADVIPGQLVTMPIEGTANGSINISDPTRNLDIDADITTKGLRLNNDSLGLVTLRGGFRQQTGEMIYEIESRNAGRSFNIKGNAGLTKENNQLSATVDLNGASIDPLNRYLGDYVTDLSGLATGQLTVSGTTSRPSIKGKVQLDSAGIKVLYLGTYYRIPRLNINVDDNLIEFGNFSIIDKFNHRANASGYISHDHFEKLNFDFDVTGRNFMFMNTGEADSDLFYGDVIADGKIYFSGPLNNMQMHILARPVKGTHFYLPMSDTKDIGKYDFITFKTYGTEMEPAKKKKKKDDVNLNIRLDIAANPDAQIDVILDATTGDIISANGNGNLQINVNTDGDFTMFGDYEINNGSYNFTFQRLTSWKFDITKNSTISWNGDPREARMNITAKYSVPKVSLYNLVGQRADVNSDKLATRQERVDVVINLRGEMMKPDIAYEIQLPDVGTLSYESGVAARLREINQDQNKALLQMYGLLLFNQFIPDDNTTTGGAGIVGKNSVGQALSAQASAILNNITGAILKNSGIGINLNYRAYNIGNQNNDNVDRNQLSAGITGNLLNNRVRIYVGGDYDWGRTATSASSNRFAGDFRVEYLLTPDGRVRVNAFSKTDYDVYNLVNRNKAGLGISYVREYNRLRELFESRRPSRRLLDSMRRVEATPPQDTGRGRKKV